MLCEELKYEKHKISYVLDKGHGQGTMHAT
jgi:hypothetical protein